MADYRIDGRRGDTIFILVPLHPQAKQNLREKTSQGEHTFFGAGLVVEHRYIDNLVVMLTEEGWSVAHQLGPIEGIEDDPDEELGT
jgi:hypothetical protein